MSAPRIALATWDTALRPSVDREGLAANEDAAIAAALGARGVVAERVAWTADDAAWATYDLVMVRTTWDYFDRPAAFRAWLAEVAAVATLWNPLEVVSWNLDKRYLFDLEARGVRLPPTVRVTPDAPIALAALLAERGWSDVVIKRAVTAGAAGQALVRYGDVAIGQAHLDALIQPFLRSVGSRGEISLIAINGRVVHAVRKMPAADDYRTQTLYGARVVPHAPEPAERELAERALAAVGRPTLHARIDMVALDDGAPALMELEVIEPYLFLDVDPTAVERVADGICARLV
jgi:glutathione synthase/RimK-type ligase-like ATP-grasp enzyme